MKIQFPWRKYQMTQACIDFYNLRLWERFNNMDLFVVETPVEGPVIAGIMGAGGQEFGLEVFRGPDIFMQMQYFLDSEGDPSDERIDTLGFSMCSYNDLGHYEKKWFKSCNFRAKNSERVPIALCKRPNQQGGLIEDDRDIRLMLYVLKGLLKAYQEGDFDPRIIDDFKFLTLKVSGDEMDPAVKVVRKSYAAAKRLQKYYKCVGPSEGPDVSELARLDRTWLIVPVYINISETKRQHCTLCVADEHSKYILSSDLIETEVGEVLHKLIKIISGDNAAEQRGVPAKIIIAERELYLELRERLVDIGIEVQCRPNHPLAMEIRRDLGGFLSCESKSDPAPVESSLSTTHSIIPADDDLAGWKSALADMMAYFYDFWDVENILRTVKVSKQFFGDGDWNYYLDQFESMSLPSYATWAVLCYRADKNDCTHAEELLAWEKLSEPVRIALEALNNAWPSLYRVAATDTTTGTIVLEDLLLSQTVTIQDQKLSESATPGMIAPFWVYQVGRFYFVNGAGPCFGVLNINRVVNRLWKLKMPAPPTTEWLRQNAHIFGRLWKLYDEISVERPQLLALQNTDGDPLELVTAVFSCENPASVKEVLGRRTDMDYDEQEDLYVWFRGKLGEVMKNTLLGRVCFKDRTIEVEVNSRKRLEGVRMILESIKGVRYLRHTTKDLQEEPLQGRKSPAALLKPEELPEDIRQAALEHMRRYYMDWLDMPIPVLGNQSPRQAVKNPKTAQQVRIMIKSMPDNIGNAGIVSVPRKEMLKSLGLPE